MNRPHSTRWLVSSAVVLALVGGAAVLRGFASSGSSTVANHARPTSLHAPQGAVVAAPTSPGPRRLQSGIPVGYAPTREGAIAAAVSFMATGEALLGMNPAEVAAAIHTMATAEAEGRILAETTTRLAAARGALAGSDALVEYRQAAVAVRVDDFDAVRARVAVWNVGVLSRAGVAPPQAGWSISTFDLAWEHDDWKVAQETVEPGPAPVPNTAVAPASSAELDRRLAGFRAYGSRP